MDADQIQAWALEADGYANAYGQYHAWDSTFDKQAVRDAYFARLARADAFEAAAKACRQQADGARYGYERESLIECAARIETLAAAEKEK